MIKRMNKRGEDNPLFGGTAGLVILLIGAALVIWIIWTIAGTGKATLDGLSLGADSASVTACQAFAAASVSSSVDAANIAKTNFCSVERKVADGVYATCYDLQDIKKVVFTPSVTSCNTETSVSLKESTCRDKVLGGEGDVEVSGTRCSTVLECVNDLNGVLLDKCTTGQKSIKKGFTESKEKICCV